MNISRIIIGIDDSKFAEHAAEYGFNMARLFNAEVGLVNIIEPIDIRPPSGTDMIMGIPSEATSVGDMEIVDIQNELAENVIERTIKTYANGINVTQFTEYGSTADGIVKCSREFNADMIVIGTHSRTGIDRLLMGSVAEHVVRHSEIPVLVVPFKETAE